MSSIFFYSHTFVWNKLSRLTRKSKKLNCSSENNPKIDCLSTSKRDFPTLWFLVHTYERGFPFSIAKRFQIISVWIEGDSPKGEVPIFRDCPCQVRFAMWWIMGESPLKDYHCEGGFPSHDFRIIYLPESIVELNIGDSHSLPYSFEDPMQASRITILSIESYSKSS